jgi:tetratricopeptide (TPR) repeat protein
VLAGDPRSHEARYLRALLRERDGVQAEARTLYTELARDASDARPLYRLARLDVAEGKHDIARARVERVLGMQPEHAGAQALMAAIEAASAVVETDPMPPEVSPGGGGASGGGGGASRGGGGGGGASGGGGYDALLARANKLAEVGKCSQAMDSYRKALDVNPGGVGALVGIGYCHLDAREFASAHAKFRAALGISPSNHEALIGIAEAYRYQGLKDEAIEAYRKYLSMHPAGKMAKLAEKQLDLLGASAKPEPEPEPEPEPKPEPEPPTGSPFDEKEDTDLGGGGSE